MDKNINTLMNELKRISRPINESANSSSNYDKIDLGLTSTIIKMLKISGATKADLSDNMARLILEVRKIRPSDTRIVTYPGICEEKKYKQKLKTSEVRKWQMLLLQTQQLV